MDFFLWSTIRAAIVSRDESLKDGINRNDVYDTWSNEALQVLFSALRAIEFGAWPSLSSIYGISPDGWSSYRGALIRS